MNYSLDRGRVGRANRRQFLALMGLGAAAIASGGALTGCSKEAGSGGTATNTDAISAVLPKYTPPLTWSSPTSRASPRWRTGS